MKNIVLIGVTIVLSIIAFKSSPKNNETTFFNEDIYIRVKDTKTEKITKMNIEDYIVGVVAAEMPASFDVEALKSQAIAARTYAVYKINTASTDYDVVTDVSNQVFIDESNMKKKWGEKYLYYYEKIRNAVNDTSGLVMKYNNEVICAFYFAISNGYTENSELVFSESKDYLESVSSLWDKHVNNYEVTNKISKEEFCNKLNISCKNIIINNIERTSTNRISNISVNEKKFKGTEFRTLLGLRSTDFDISVHDYVEITTRGYGHGVGMSQYGANEMAKLGKKYDEILKYYYKDIEIEKINV